MKFSALLATAVLAALIAVATYNMGGCASTGKARIAPADQAAIDTIPPIGAGVQATGDIIAAAADKGQAVSREAAVLGDAANGHIKLALGVPGLPAAAVPPLKSAATETHDATAKMLVAESEFKDIQMKVADLSSVKPALAALETKVTTIAQDKADEHAARVKAEAEVAAVNGTIATGLRVLAEWCFAAAGVCALGMFLLPVGFKTNIWEVLVLTGAAAILMALSVVWAKFVALVSTHPVATVAIIVGIVGVAIICIGRVKGWFNTAVGYAESVKSTVLAKAPSLKADIKAVGADTAATTGPLFGAAQRIVEKDWVKLTAWEHRLLHKDVAATAAAHVDAVAAAAAIVPLVPAVAVPVAATVATPGATITTVTTTAPVSVTGP